MSGSERPRLQPTGSLPTADGAARRPGVSAVRTARLWAAGALTVATVVLGAYLALVVVGTWFVVSVVDAVADVGAGPFDLTPLLVDVAPGLLVGWGAGLVLAGVLGRGEAMGARTAGCVAGALGSLAGGAVLALTGVL